MGETATMPAAIALAAAWAACVDDLAAGQIPRFDIGDHRALPLDEAAAILAHQPRPLSISGAWAEHSLVISTTAPSESHQASGAWGMDLVSTNPHARTILVVAMSIRLRVTAEDLRASTIGYHMGVPSGMVSDVVPSAFVSGMRLPPDELAGIDQVVVFGRGDGASWSFTVRFAEATPARD